MIRCGRKLTRLRLKNKPSAYFISEGQQPIYESVETITEEIVCQRELGHKDQRHMGYDANGNNIMWTDQHG